MSEYLPKIFESDDQTLIRLFNRLKALNIEVLEFSHTNRFKEFLKSHSDEIQDSKMITKEDHAKEIEKLK